MAPARELSSNSMVCIHHAGHTVKPKPMELIFIHIESDVALEESHHGIVEETTIQMFVSSFTSLMEVQVIRPVELISCQGHSSKNLNEQCQREPSAPCHTLHQLFPSALLEFHVSLSQRSYLPATQRLKSIN